VTNEQSQPYRARFRTPDSGMTASKTMKTTNNDDMSGAETHSMEARTRLNQPCGRKLVGKAVENLQILPYSHLSDYDTTTRFIYWRSYAIYYEDPVPVEKVGVLFRRR
jgi:hypothetical protein